MSAAQSTILQRYQQPMWGSMDRALRNCFTGSAILGLAVLIAVFVVPTPAPEPVTMEQVPERLARLILEKPAAPGVKLPEPANVVETPKVEVPPAATPKAPPRRRTSPPKVTEDRGMQGRQKARQEVTENLAGVTGSLDKVLDNLSKSLPASESASDDKKGPSRRRSRGVRSGRSSEQLSSVGGVSTLSSPDVSGSAIESDGVSIAAITDLTVSDDGGGSIPQASGSGGGGGSSSDLRSNQSLLATVRRYAPGIQFCYDNELKKNPGLRGKLVVSITVLASGAVSDVTVVEDTLHSANVSRCVLAQIRGWKLPEIPYGTTTFKTPFVFTPPE